MACGSCGKRGHLIGAAVTRAMQGKPVMPLVRGIGRTIVHDIARTATKPPPSVNPRLIGRFK